MSKTSRSNTLPHVPPRPVPTTPRTFEVARLFGLPTDPPAEEPTAPPLPIEVPRPGTITLLTGPSGGGKSTALRQIAARFGSAGRVIDVMQLPLRGEPCVDLLPDLPTAEALALLGRAGLGEAWTYLRPPRQLSDGQRFRLRLALALHAADHRGLLVIDEFTASLDRVTAAAVARSVRRLVSGSATPALLCATCHDDIAAALQPDDWWHCDFGKLDNVRKASRSGSAGAADPPPPRER